jgi:2-(1,2-epoxy-1,2-dihydrophenyl)acetyl-CoA isomerase
MPKQLDAEAAASGLCARTQDFRAGLDAFFARQPARFVGR